MKSRPPVAPAPVPQILRTSRGDEERARERLLLAALRLFAEQGYAKTSIRQIGLAANVNVASVSYYFGNKAGLYRAVFWGEDGPVANAGAPPGAAPDTTGFSLRHLFHRMLEPLKSGAQARLWIKLHRREMIEPTGLWQQKINQGMQPMHAALVSSLCERLGIDRPDDEVQALATLIVGPAVHLLVNCEVIDVLAPQLLADADAVDRWCERLLANAEALIRAERRRRRTRPNQISGGRT
jgi:AcrR family transcriptional regulator